MFKAILFLFLITSTLYGQVTLPTFQAAHISAASVALGSCGTQNCGGPALCNDNGDCNSTNVSMRWHASSENSPDNLVLTKQSGGTTTLSARTTGDRGWYRKRSSGNNPNGQHGASNQNTYTGHYKNQDYYRSFFAWNLASVAGETITAAQIQLDINNWYNTDGGTDAYSKIWEIESTTYAEIITSKDYPRGLEIYDVMGNGVLYSCLTIDKNNMGLYTFQLSAAAVSKINSLNGGYFIIGNTVSCE